MGGTAVIGSCIWVLLQCQVIPELGLIEEIVALCSLPFNTSF